MFAYNLINRLNIGSLDNNIRSCCDCKHKNICPHLRNSIYCTKSISESVHQFKQTDDRLVNKIENGPEKNIIDGMSRKVPENIAKNIVNNTAHTQNTEQADGCGLLHFRKWWERNKVDISVNHELITGTPVFTEKNTLRVINKQYSYFIPLEKVDYIRTSDGLDSCSLVEKQSNTKKSNKTIKILKTAK